MPPTAETTTTTEVLSAAAKKVSLSDVLKNNDDIFHHFREILEGDQPKGAADKRHPFGSNKFAKSHKRIPISEMKEYVSAVQSVNELHNDVSVQIELCRWTNEPYDSDPTPFNPVLCDEKIYKLQSQQYLATLKLIFKLFSRLERIYSFIQIKMTQLKIMFMRQCLQIDKQLLN